MLQVEIETGSHSYGDLGNAAVFVSAMLEKVGYSGNWTWEVHITKQLHCSDTSPPIRIRNWKPYAVELRVKPEILATYDFQANLVLPNGANYRAQDVYEQLSSAQSTVNNYILSGDYRKKSEPVAEVIPSFAIPTVPPPQPIAVARADIDVEEIPARESVKEVKDGEPPIDVLKSLAGITRTKSLLHPTLRAIHAESEQHNSAESFKLAVADRCGWHECAKNARSRVFHELEKAGYIQQHVAERGRIKGWMLTSEGREEIGLQVTPPPPSFDNAPLLMKSAEALNELAQIGFQLLSNRKRRRDLEEEKKRLDAEILALDGQYSDLQKFFRGKPAIVEAIHQLSKVKRPGQ